MDKNIIKDYLSSTFLSEAKKDAKPKDNNGKSTKVVNIAEPTQEKKAAKGTQGVPGVKVTDKYNKQSGKSNKEGVGAIAKDMKAYEAPLTKPDANASEMSPNKFNYKDDKEKTYHDEVEIMNGMEMLQYDRTPDDNFRDRAMEAIEGSSRMGNNPDWANVVVKGWGGDKEFGKNLVKRIKASSKKRSEQTPTAWMQGKSNVVDVKDNGHKPYALESFNKKSTIKEDMNNQLQASEIVTNKNENALQESNKNKKQPMKRLKFKKEFNGVGNALKLIPESYKVDNKVFEMTDGNESYKVRWEGSLTEGAAVILTASDKKVVNEDIQRMKALFNYKSEDTLGVVKGKARVDENAKFTDVWNKTKNLLSESFNDDELEGPEEWEDAVKHAPEAKKHMVQPSSMENGHQAPAPKEGIWGKEKMAHSPEGKKHMVQPSSMENGHQAPAPKQGHWDEIKIKGTTGVKNTASKEITSQAKKQTTAEFGSALKHAPEATKNIQGSAPKDKQASKPKTGDWDTAKKGQAPEASKNLKKKA